MTAQSGTRRDAVLGRIRRSLGVSGAEAQRKAIVRGRLENHPRGIVPKRGQLSHTKRAALFAQMAEEVQTTVERVKARAHILPAVRTFLRAHNLPSEIVHGSDPYIHKLGWNEHKSLSRREGRAEPGDEVSLTKAFAGVAESGTLVMLSGPDNPVTLNFMPYTEIVVLEAKDIAGDYETVWDRIRELKGDTQMPRTVNWVTGPSRSGDIGRVLNLGAHGPGRLHVVIVG